ncbi:hypothetical protein, partial [Enterobacter hormaechei]|uniref:hypothetical protein n=1 Tax=Enterobacter hormaechei TaxID=158836 RepID=UPI002E2E7517
DLHNEAAPVLGALNMLVGMRLNTTTYLNHFSIKNKTSYKKPKPPPSGGSSIALWEVVNHGVVSSRLCGDNAATGF